MSARLQRLDKQRRRNETPLALLDLLDCKAVGPIAGPPPTEPGDRFGVCCREVPREMAVLSIRWSRRTMRQPACSAPHNAPPASATAGPSESLGPALDTDGRAATRARFWRGLGARRRTVVRAGALCTLGACTDGTGRRLWRSTLTAAGLSHGCDGPRSISAERSARLGLVTETRLS